MLTTHCACPFLIVTIHSRASKAISETGWVVCGAQVLWKHGAGFEMSIHLFLQQF